MPDKIMVSKKMQYLTTYLTKYPWARSYIASKSRCRTKNHPYYKRGIKNRMSLADFKFLWFRDKAWELESPSIDRIDGDGDYILKNCRFIEISENRARAARRWWSAKTLQLSLNGRLIKIWNSANEAARALNISQGNISSCVNGHYKQAYGFKWKYSGVNRRGKTSEPK